MANKKDLDAYENYINSWCFVDDYDIHRNGEDAYTWVIRHAKRGTQITFINGVPYNVSYTTKRKGNALALATEVTSRRLLKGKVSVDRILSVLKDMDVESSED